MAPTWLTLLAWVSLAAAVLSARDRSMIGRTGTGGSVAALVLLVLLGPD